MAKPAKVREQPLEGVVYLGNDGKYLLGETGWLCLGHTLMPCSRHLSSLLVVQ